jgi:hypothetical protein
MSLFKSVSTVALVIGLLSLGTDLYAHGSGSVGSTDKFMVTRHFTGTWDQVDHESQGLSLDVIEQTDGSRRSTVYWFTYGDDRKTAWYLGIGDLIEDRIEFQLYDSIDVGFLQAEISGNESVLSMGTMSIVFSSCNAGVVTFETTHDEVGSGSFNIERISEIMNTHCSGGISDDMHSDATFGEQWLALTPARDGIIGSGHATYEDYPGHMEFEVEVKDLPDGDYDLYVGMQDHGDITVHDGHGSLEFRSPGETGSILMTFDPRGMQIEIHDDRGVVLSSFENRFEEDNHNHNGDDYGHNYDCEFGHGPGNGPGNGQGNGPGNGPGHGMSDCVNDGEVVEIEIDLVNTGVLIDAKGEAEWEMNSDRVEFSVEIEDVPIDFYALKVGGTEVGIIEAFERHDGDVYGRIKFRDPESHGREHLDFEPRGEKIEVLQGGSVILEIEFPSE